MLWFKPSVSCLIASLSIPHQLRSSVVRPCIKNQDKDARDKTFTVLFRKPPARCSASSGPISLAVRMSVVSVYTNREYIAERKIKKERKKFTVFSFKIKARCLAASFSTPVLLRSRVVSVYIEKVNIEASKIKFYRIIL